jgi:hypothetical protein
MNKIVFLFTGIFFIVHGLLEATGYFWRDWFITFPAPTWPGWFLAIIGFLFLVYPSLKEHLKKSIIILFWLLCILALLLEFWFMIEPLRMGEILPSLIMANIGISAILSIIYVEWRAGELKR